MPASPARVSLRTGLFVTISAAAILVGAEVGAGRFHSSPSNTPPEPRRWVGVFDPDPVLGLRVRPLSTLKTYYNESGGGYFDDEEPRQAYWHLQVESPVEARLVLPQDRPDVIRVEVVGGTQGPAWLVRLVKSPLIVEQGIDYVFSFRARADGPRRFEAWVGEDHPPWDVLGFFETVELTPEWQTFTRAFRASASDDNAHIQFSFGGSPFPVEIADVALRAMTSKRFPADTPLEPPGHFAVRYDINELGCRGPSVAVAKRPGVERILLLGGSYTMGLGLRDEDTFARRLEGLSRISGGAGPIEVLNCGLPGYEARESREFFALSGSAYRPDLVLLVIDFAHDPFYRGQTRREYLRDGPSRLERLSSVWAVIQDHRAWQRRRYNDMPDFGDNAAEVRRLDQILRDGGIRLGVVLVHGPDDVWGDFAETMRTAMQAASIPTLDLGPFFQAPMQGRRFVAHPSAPKANADVHALIAREIMAFTIQQPATPPVANIRPLMR